MIFRSGMLALLAWGIFICQVEKQNFSSQAREVQFSYGKLISTTVLTLVAFHRRFYHARPDEITKKGAQNLLSTAAFRVKNNRCRRASPNVASIKHHKSMYQVPQLIWNQIAREVPLKHPEMKAAFQVPEEKASLFLETWDKLEDGSGKSLLTLPLQTLLPSLAEPEALNLFFQKHPEMQALRQAIPQVDSPKEAVLLAKQDSTLNPQEEASLLSLLEDLPTRLQRIGQAAQQVGQ